MLKSKSKNLFWQQTSLDCSTRSEEDKIQKFQTVFLITETIFSKSIMYCSNRGGKGFRLVYKVSPYFHLY